jgi:uncharacterized protein
VKRDIRHNAPLCNHDYDFFYNGLAERVLLIQKCEECGRLRNPPAPMCPNCHSVKFVSSKSEGTGVIYSYTVHRHPPLKYFSVPHVIVLVELDEGIRMIGSLESGATDAPLIGKRVRTKFVRQGDFDNFAFVLSD